MNKNSLKIVGLILLTITLSYLTFIKSIAFLPIWLLLIGYIIMMVYKKYEK